MRKSLEISIVLLLIMTIASTNFFLLGSHIVFAAQNNFGDTNNIEFDAYFVKGEEKTHSIEAKIDEEQKIILEINVGERGIIDNGKITIEDPNFEIIENKVQNQYIKAINIENNQIELNQIIYGNRVVIELPISFKKQESFSEDYFERENKILLKGLYKNQKEIEIEKETITQIIWKKETDISLSEEIEKFINMGQEGLLLQQKIITSVEGDYLPRKEEKLEINVPKLDEMLPVEVKVLFNGFLKEGINYNKTNGKLFIESDNTGRWGKSVNEYKVIYTYNNIQFSKKTINLNTKLTAQLYMQGDIQKEDIQNDVSIEEKGSIISIFKASSNDIYKGYLYAANGKETVFKENNKIEISKEGEIILNENEDSFLDEQNNKYDLINSVVYKQTLINKTEFERIYGENGQITISDNNGTSIAVIDSNTQASSDGNIEVNYPQELNKIMIHTSKPIQCGVINILNTKALKSDTGYSKEKLKLFNRLNMKTNVESFEKKDTIESEVVLQDTKTDAKIEISNKNLSTLQTNENVQLLVTLKSNSEEYDLYKDPNIQVVLPKEIKANIKSINQLNAQEELQIVNPNTVIDSNGSQIINLQLQGEQKTFENEVTEGIQVAITADITIDKTVPSREEKIVINYTNENRAGISLSSFTDVIINSKYGVMALNKISNYNSKDDEIEVIDNDIKIGNLDANKEEMTAEQEISVINNYEDDITDVSIIINNLDNNELTINNQTVKSNLGLILKELLSTSEQIEKIYYSEDGNSWVEDTENLKIAAIKIQLKDNRLSANNSIDLKCKLGIPAELGVNKSTCSNLVLSYTYAGEIYTTNSAIVLKTEENNINNEEPTYDAELNKIKIEVIEKNAEGLLKENQEVKEGEKIKYIVNVTNISDTDIDDIQVEANHKNVIFWKHNEYEAYSSYTGEKSILTKYEENADLEKIAFEIEKLKAGENKQLEYQITIKNIEGTENKTLGNIKVINGDEVKQINISERNIRKAKLKLLLKDSFYEQTDLYTTGGFPIEMVVKNNEIKDLENLIIELPLPDEVSFTTEEFFETDNVTFIENKNNVVRFKINKIKAGETEAFSTQLIVNKIPIQELQANVSNLLFRVQLDDEKYYSNELSRTFYQSETEIIAEQTSDKEEDYVENGDIVTFTAKIENKGNIPKNLDINDSVPDIAVIRDAYLVANNKKEKVNISKEYNNLFVTKNLEANEKIELVIKTEIDVKKSFDNTITNYINITGNGVNIKTNEITYKIKKENKQSNQDNSTEVEKNQIIEPQNTKKDIYSISGKVWIDSNKNGKLDNNEKVPNDVEVILLNSNTGNIVKDENQKYLTTKVDENGIYKFTNIEEGTYIVLFKYDSTRYRITEYKVNGISDDENSDVFSKNVTINGQNINAAITETLKVDGGNLNNINAGFIENEKFDLRLDKYINKIIVINSKGTIVNQYNKAQFAKIEIDSKQLSNSTVIIEYQMKITNEGELPGYANEIVDYISSDLSFSSEINGDWYETTNGEIHSKKLSNEIIKPGESKEIILTLSKKMSQNNTGIIINTAEISKSNNDLSVKDIDSTAGNKISGEDDISTAQVLISIKTGRFITYITMVAIVMLTIVIGIYAIKKKVII